MQHDAFQGDLNQYFLDEYFTVGEMSLYEFWPAMYEHELSPRQKQLESAMESGYPSISGDTDPRTKRILI
jgi:hypothetical protein